MNVIAIVLYHGAQNSRRRQDGLPNVKRSERRGVGLNMAQIGATEEKEVIGSVHLKIWSVFLWDRDHHTSNVRQGGADASGNQFGEEKMGVDEA